MNVNAFIKENYSNKSNPEPNEKQSQSNPSGPSTNTSHRPDIEGAINDLTKTMQTGR